MGGTVELIYLYIKKYEEVFENVEFNFSSNYIATMKNNQLLIEKNKKSVKKYYGDNINNVVMFLGKNGVGKSTLLDILGMNRKDRISDTYQRKSRKRDIKYSYFILYHLYDDYFGFEFVDYNFLSGKDRISNIDMQNENAESALYKLPMGNIFKLENEVFKYCDNIMVQWLGNQDIRSKLEYAYITSDKYNNRISNRYREYYEDYMFERRYYLEGSNYEHLYKYFIYLKDINNELLQEKNITIENSIKIDEHMLDSDKSRGDYLHHKKRELDAQFDLKSNVQIEIEKKFNKKKIKKDSRSKKEIFLETFCAEAIEYYFLEQFVGWSENEGKRIDVNRADMSLADVERAISELDEKLKTEVINGLTEIMDFQEEYALLLYKIQNSRTENGKIDLKAVLEYTLNRVEIAASGTINIFDRHAVTEILNLLEELPKSYFVGKRSIRIKCESGKINEKIIELLRKYDYYFKIRNNEQGSNRISRILSVSFPKMSEGQRVFLDIISKAISAIYTIQPGDSLVLLIDEPDRALHPELARRFLATLLDSINKCQDRNIQIILSSHSPFIVTDILPEYVYSIDTENGKRKIINNKDTYATNIYYLLMDSFMLENTFGEYSYRQLKNIVQILNEKEEIGEEKLEWIKNIIDRVGEKTIKKKIMQLYEKKAHDKNNLINMLLTEKDENKLLKVREILEKND
ncbi:AAA family ATPase [Lachnospiraceae bacterium WCA-693-APC-MOT-I]|uniref:AAA family ATPase n=1 Tax=Velocimicrobium porci TaxID=2606634 RepID=A0A6L5Y3S7_9FIRM|nr:AAA family ATPase [Velocimicrobium porci]